MRINFTKPIWYFILFSFWIGRLVGRFDTHICHYIPLCCALPTMLVKCKSLHKLADLDFIQILTVQWDHKYFSVIFLFLLSIYFECFLLPLRRHRRLFRTKKEWKQWKKKLFAVEMCEVAGELLWLPQYLPSCCANLPTNSTHFFFDFFFYPIDCFVHERANAIIHHRKTMKANVRVQYRARVHAQSDCRIYTRAHRSNGSSG